MTESVQNSGRISVGTVLAGRYELVQLLGTGGFGSVYKALQNNLGTFVAVKLLNAEMIPDAVALMRLQNEAKALAALDHTAIPKVHCVEALPGGGVFVAMDYIEGVSLAQLLEHRGKLPLDEAVPLFVQVADAVQHAHDKGIVHRDLKPSNIMVDGDRAYVLDFGIAKNLDSVQKVTQTGAVLGTIRYMSPEQAQGQAVTAQSDIYSLGCVLYETLSGKALFESDSAMHVMMRHVQETLPPLNSPELKALSGPLAKALAKRPAERFQSMSQFAAALRAPDMVAPQKSKRSEAGLKFNKSVIGGVALFCVVLVAALLFVWNYDRERAYQMVTASDFTDPSYQGPIDEQQLMTFVSESLLQRERLRPNDLLSKLEMARNRRAAKEDWQNAVPLGKAEVLIVSYLRQPHWDAFVHTVRDEMLIRDRPNQQPTVDYLDAVLRKEESAKRGQDTEAYAVRHMLYNQYIAAGDMARAKNVLKTLLKADPEKQPYYYSAGQFGSLAREAVEKPGEEVIAKANKFIATYGRREPYRIFLPGFYSVLGQQYADPRIARDYWWKGYEASRSMLDRPNALQNDADIDRTMLLAATFVGSAAIARTCDLVDLGKDTKEHAAAMLRDYESRIYCQESAPEIIVQLRKRIAALPGTKGGAGV